MYIFSYVFNRGDNKMKRTLRFVLIQTIILVIIACTIPFTMVSAASNTYKMDELGLEVSFPSYFTVITEDISSSDPIFDRLGTTKSALISKFKSGNIYMNAIPNNSSTEEIVVTMTNGVFDNYFNNVTESGIFCVYDAFLVFADYYLGVCKKEGIPQEWQIKIEKILCDIIGRLKSK